MELRRATIDLGAIAHNYQHIKKLVPQSNIIAVIKSNAYGHGLIPVAQTLSQADAFGVSVLEEAMALREHGVTQKIILMTGVCRTEELIICAQHNIDIVVHQLDHLAMLSDLDEKYLLNVWLKLDVGMHRLGFNDTEIEAIFDRLTDLKVVAKPIHLMSHLPNADIEKDNITPKQIKLFAHYADQFNVPATLAKSAGVLAWPDAHFQWVRPGIMLYGISPLVGYHGAQHGLIPAMEFSAKIVAIRHFSAGDKISYGGDWQCPEDMKVAIVGAGYSCGYPRHAPSGTPVLIHGKKCPLVGRVCMDMIAVDCRTCPEVEMGDEALLWGKDLPIEMVANKAETIAYELVCHVAGSISRHHEK